MLANMLLVAKRAKTATLAEHPQMEPGRVTDDRRCQCFRCSCITSALPTFYLFNLLIEACPGSCNRSWLVWLADFAFHVADGCAAATAPHLCREYAHLESTLVKLPVCLNRLDEAADARFYKQRSSVWRPGQVCCCVLSDETVIYHDFWWSCSLFFPLTNLIKNSACPVMYSWPVTGLIFLSSLWPQFQGVIRCETLKLKFKI